MDITLLLLVCKLIHVILLWFAFYVAEKAALDAFITKVYVEKREKPPRMEWIPTGVFVADFAAVLLLVVCAYFIIARSISAPLIGGQRLVMLLGLDLMASWFLAFMVSLVAANVAQRQSCMRYKDDGLRGIRAYCYVALCLSVVMCVIPYFYIL